MVLLPYDKILESSVSLASDAYKDLYRSNRRSAIFFTAALLCALKNLTENSQSKIISLSKWSIACNLGLRIHQKPKISLNTTTLKNLIAWKDDP